MGGTGNKIQGNIIGLAPDGKTNLHNDNGITVQGATNYMIGGDTPELCRYPLVPELCRYRGRSEQREPSAR